MSVLASPRNPRYQSLDFWRGVACLLVVIFHSSYYASTEQESPALVLLMKVIGMFWLGVPIFFVISGYCIAATADRGRQIPASLGTYFRRRFRRIFPPYWIFLGASVLLVVGLDEWLRLALFTDTNQPIPSPFALNKLQWLGNLTLTETWRANFSSSPKQLFAGHAWTLCYEEQFYIVMGLLLWLTPRRLFSAAAGVTVFCLFARHLFPLLGLPVRGFFFDGQWLIFASGVLVYYQINYGRRERNWQVMLLIGLGLLYAARHPTHVFDDKYSADLSAFIGGCFALLLLILHPLDERIVNSRWLRPITTCGLMCYSLYLVHWPIVKALSHLCSRLGVRGVAATLLITVPICLTASILVARFFHLQVERRFLNTTPQARNETGIGKFLSDNSVPVPASTLSNH